VTTTSIRPITRPERVSHDAGFWVVAFAFVIGMAFSTIPTPLWSLYRKADNFSTFMVTVAFAAYAVGVIASLFLAGHVSDWIGRRRVLIPALLLEVVAGILFLTWTSLPGLIVARVVTGLGVGMITATATAHLAELHAVARPGAAGIRPGVVAVAANLGGLALGPLVAGFLVQFVAGPLVVPDAIFLGLLLVAAVGIWLVPETVEAESRAYRPQRVTVPNDARARYFAVTTAAFGLFAIMGLFTSLAPSLLSSIGATSPLVGGFAAFLVFASAAVAQVVLGAVHTTRQLAIGLSVTAAGLVVLAVGVVSTSVAGFLVGGLVAGAGAGVLLKGALGTAAQLAPAESRAEALAGVFLGAYVGVVIPVVGVGFASNHGMSLATAFVAFAVVDLVILAGSALALQRNPVVAR
jgi:predicted MFS family arabinose efflux permease